MAQLHLSSTIWLLSHLILVATQSGSLIPTSLPTCAQTCTALQEAATGCVPPAAPVTDQNTYQSCFCQSALLSSLQTSSSNLCPSQCSDADYTAIDTWYKSVCPSNNAAAPPVVTVTTTLTTSTFVATSPAVSATGGSESAPSSSPSGITADEAQPLNGSAWFSTHWRWVIMLVVLFSGLLLLALIATLLHRRHRRRREAAENLGPRPDMQVWAPNQRSVHDVRDFGVEHMFQGGTGQGTQPESAKGKEKVSMDVMPLRGAGNKKLKKGLLG